MVVPSNHATVHWSQNALKNLPLVGNFCDFLGEMRPQIKFCGWAYKVAHNIWNFVPNLKISEKRMSLIEVQITT